MDPATPLTASSQFIQAGKCAPSRYSRMADVRIDDSDDDLNEEDIIGFTMPSPAPDKGKGRVRELEQLATPSDNGGMSSPQLSGNIGSATAAPTRPARQTVGGMQVETRCVLSPCRSLLLNSSRYTGVDTLDEPVTTTIARDLFSIYNKLVQVLYPRKSEGREVLRYVYTPTRKAIIQRTLGTGISGDH